MHQTKTKALSTENSKEYKDRRKNNVPFLEMYQL